jgi:NAD-dependent SIR2 family protein deacetylase
LKVANKLKTKINEADKILIGAGAGLSTAAGMAYGGDRFDKYFWDFKDKLGIQDMYSGGFYIYPDPETKWAFWSRNIWINRYMPAPKSTYSELLDLVEDKDYFVITTNVDHQFQAANFDKKRLFYTQGDYGLFQKKADSKHTYDNYELVRAMIESQGFKIGSNNELLFNKSDIQMKIDSRLAQKAEDYVLNLRIDEDFVEDEGWHRAAERFDDFAEEAEKNKTLYLELGVGMNTPVIIKYPFWQWTLNNPQGDFVTIDAKTIMYPKEIENRSLGIKGDIDQILKYAK